VTGGEGNPTWSHAPGPAPAPSDIMGAGGVRLRTWSWPVEHARGRVQLTHGLSEHLGRYREVAGVLMRAGWSVFGHDHRGHGESDGERGVLRDFDHLVQDVAAVRERADDLAPGPGRPLLLGHSMGGLVALRYLQSAGEPPPRVVISAPWLGTRVVLPLWQRIAARALRYVAPEFVLKRALDTSLLTRDQELGDAYRDDPTIHRCGSAGLLAQVERAQAAALGDGVPGHSRVLLLVPLDDRVTDPERTQEWAARVGPERIQVVRLPGVRHEPFQDIERATVLRTVADWLNEGTPDESVPGTDTRYERRNGFHEE